MKIRQIMPTRGERALVAGVDLDWVFWHEVLPLVGWALLEADESGDTEVVGLILWEDGCYVMNAQDLPVEFDRYLQPEEQVSDAELSRLEVSTRSRAELRRRAQEARAQKRREQGS